MNLGLTFARQKAIKVVNRIDHLAAGLTNAAIDELYKSDDGELLLESVTMEELDSTLFYGAEAGDDFMMEAITSKKARVSRTVKAFSVALNQALNASGLTASKDVEISKPRKTGHVAVMTGKIAISDGQSVSVAFHAPDEDPLVIKDNDTLIAFRFMVNGRDVTHAVAPRGGSDISLKQVTAALSSLVAKNSEKFVARQKENTGLKQEIEQADQQAEQFEAEMAAISELITQTESVTAQANSHIEKLQRRIDKQNALQEQLQSEIDGMKAQKMPEPEPQQPASGDAGGAEPEQVSNDTPEGTVIGKGGYFTFNDTVWNVLDITSESVAIQARGDDRVEHLKKGDLLAKRYVFTGFNDETDNQLNEAETIASKLDLTQYVSEVRGKPMLSFGGQDVAYDALREAGFSIDDARIAAQKIRVDFNMGDYSVINNPLVASEPEPTYEQRYLDRVSRIEEAETKEQVETILSEEQSDSEHTPEGGQQVEDAANYRKLQLRFAEEKKIKEAQEVRYWYGLKARPVGLGATPNEPNKGILSNEEALEKFPDAGVKVRHGAIAYGRKLTDKEVYDFELQRLSENTLSSDEQPATEPEPEPEPQQQPEAQSPVSDLQAIYDAVNNGEISLKIGKERVSGLMAAKPQSVQPSLREASGTKRKKAFLEALSEAMKKQAAYNPNAPVVNGYDFNSESYNVIDEINMFGKSWNEVGQARPEKLFQYIEDSNLPDEVLDAAKAYYGQQAEPEPEPVVNETPQPFDALSNNLPNSVETVKRRMAEGDISLNDAKYWFEPGEASLYSLQTTEVKAALDKALSARRKGVFHAALDEALAIDQSQRANEAEPAEPAEPVKPHVPSDTRALIANINELGGKAYIDDDVIVFEDEPGHENAYALHSGGYGSFEKDAHAWLDGAEERAKKREREAQRETLAKFVKGVRMPKGWKLDKSEIDEEIWPRVYIETPFEKHDMNGSLGYVLVPAHDDVTKVNLTYHEGSVLKNDVQSVKEAVSIIEDELTSDSPENLKDFLDDLDEDAELSPEAQALVDKYKERNGMNEPEPEQPTSELDVAVASLKELVASSSLNSDEYMEKMEKAFTTITEADKLDEYEPLMNEAADKLTAIMDAEERGETA